MNATIVCLMAALSSQPAAESTASVYRMSPSFAAAVRGQTPGYDELPGSSETYGGTTVPPTYGPGDPFSTAPLDLGTPGIASPVVGDPFSPVFGFYAGYENVIVQPYFSSDAAFEFDDGAAPDFQRVIQFDWDLEYSPRVWFGYAGPGGVGAQVRYWQFDHGVNRGATDGGAGFFESEFEHDNDVSLEIATADGDSIVTRRDLELHVLDFEGTWHSVTSTWGAVRVSGGIRYVRMDQNYGAKIVDAGGMRTAALFTHHDFEGVGPTIAVLARRRIGPTNFALFASGRLSAVFGDASIEMREIDGPALGDSWSKAGNDLIPITEMQLGAEWWATIWPGARFFLRAALEGQVWFDAGTGMNTTTDEHVTSPQIGNLGFFGFAIATGLTY